jgi:hypothetical protein
MAITGSEMGGNQSPRCRSAFKPFCKQLFLGEKRQGNPRRDTTAMFSLRYSTDYATARIMLPRHANGSAGHGSGHGWLSGARTWLLHVYRALREQRPQLLSLYGSQI